MNIMDTLIPEFQHETANTRKLLERVPSDKLDYTPHAKSMTMGALASHLVEIQGWVKPTLELDVMDIPDGYAPWVATSTDEILAKFDEHLAEANATMASGISNEAMMGMWKLTMGGGDPMIEMPRVAVFRGFILSHQIHHRGQLEVYLRIHDVPLPSIYGPSADEQG